MSEEVKHFEETFESTDLVHTMRKSFLEYSMSVIVSRALPDVRDGLKPVHRRILYGMSELGVTPDKPHKKSARIVGDVMGKYHPHGDSAIYDAMVRMAQDFSYRYPLIDGHGNFGSVDGDGAAAMRYTEARMSKIALEMLRDINKDTINFRDNYDSTEREPEVLPARIPNLLVNGATGIAVGMATNIPPHNLAEVISALHLLMKNPDVTTTELMEALPGPDFPTGGIVLGKSGIRRAYETGRGSITVRGRVQIEELKNGKERIIITELPYMVNKARLVERIAQLHHEKKIEGITYLNDESDRVGMRVVIEVRRDVSASVVLNNLYKLTPLQSNFGFNMLAIVNQEPKVLSLKEILRHYLDHQEEVVRRRSLFDKKKAEDRAHILEGLQIALDHIDAIVAILRSSASGDIAKDRFMNEYGLSDKQAQAILDMRMVRLTGLEREKIDAEYNELQATIQYLEKVLASEELRYEIIEQELLEIQQRFDNPRRTELLVGDIVNTNAQYISAKLTNIGIDLYYQTTVGDNYGRLMECLENAFKRVDLVITTGGLGPTVDDITKEVVANYFGEELEVIERYYDLIVKKYSERGFGEVASGGRKEASILKNSKLLENEVGLAPGFFYEKDNKKIIVLPGPPREMTWMVDNQVLPLLKQYSNDILLMKTLEIKGVPEGKIDDRLKNYFEMSNPTVAPYAKEGCVHVRIAMKGDRGSTDYLIAEIDKIANEIVEIYPQAVEIKEE